MLARTKPLLAAAALLAGALLPAAAPASADTGPVDLGFSRLGDVLLDEEHGHLFLTQGPGGDGVRVVDLSGQPVTTIAGLPDAHGMALSADGRSLWVAVPRAGLVQLDTTTLAVGRTIALPTGHCAGDVAVVGSRLVYGHSCTMYLGTGGYGGVGAVDTATGAVVADVTSGPYYKPVVAAGPAGQVYAADAGLSPTSLYLYDVGGPTPTLVAARSQACSNLRELSASPDGGQVVTSCGYPYQHTAWSHDKLETLGSYSTGPYPLAGAWSGDGQVFAAGDDSPYGTDVSVFAAGATSPSWTRDFGSSSALLQPRGLALSTDGSRAWAVTSAAGGGLELRVLDRPTREATRLTLAADPPSLFVGEKASVGGWLSWGGAGVAGATLAVTRTATDATAVPLPDVVTRSDGTYVFSDSPAEPGSYTYTVSWSGDATRAGATASTTVTVDPLGSSLELRLGSGASAAGDVQGDVVLRYSGTASAAGRTVHLERYAQGLRTVLPDLVTDAYGGASFVDSPPVGTVSYTAWVDADGSLPGASASATITTELTTTTLTAQAPATTPAGSPLTVTGQLTSPGAVVAGATVSVSRSGCGSDWSATAVTTPNGAWAVSDPSPSAGTCTYSASYAGDDRYAASSATVTTSVLVATDLTVVAPATAEVGAPLAVRGTLSTGTAAVSGAAVSVVRSGCSTSGWSLTVLTAGDGSWTATDPSPPVGPCSYAASYLGDERHASSKSSATTDVVLRTPALSVTVARGTGSAKKQVTVTGELGTTLDNRVLTITAQPSGGAEVVLASGAVDSTGKLTARYTAKTTTTYRVKFSGDAWYCARTVLDVQ